MQKAITWLKLDRVWATMRSLPPPWLLLGLAVPAVMLLFWLLLVPFSNLLAGDEVRALSGEKRVQARDATRQLVLQATGGTAALAALIFTARSYLLNRRGQQTQRFKDAGEQLGSDSIVTRIAGVYSLEHVMRESPEDHATVVEVLCAFIREHAPPAHLESQEQGGPLDHPNSDVQAALTVVARRPERPEGNLVIDLSGLYLEGARLPQARLAHADLRNSYLHSVDLSGADLSQADLSRAVLKSSDLSSAKLRQADLASASLRHANAYKADFRSADLYGSDLTGAHLEGSHLDEANLIDATLIEARLSQAFLNGSSLVCANLKKATMVKSDLSGADLSSTFVEGTKFHRATMKGTSFRGAEAVQFARFDFVDASEVVGFTQESWSSVSTNSITRAPKVFDLD